MKRKQGAILTAVLVDYDNIYLALKRKNDEAAKRFAKNAALWIKEIESGGLITPTNSLPANVQRRIVLNRCYGNPVPRRNTHDNSTDMSSFPFVRHHFLRAGFEVIDCPPLTVQQKNASDIRMVMDMRDFLQHDTYFDEFIILSGDADFTPVMHRLRAHARRTVIFANDHTAAPYTAISDGEIREQDLITLLIDGRIGDAPSTDLTPPIDVAALRSDIIREVVAVVDASAHPIPLEALADRAIRQLGQDKTTGTSWAGAGSFRELLAQSLPQQLRLSEQPPYFVYDSRRQIQNSAAPAIATAPQRQIPAPAPAQAHVPTHAPAPMLPPTPTAIQQPQPRQTGIDWPADLRPAPPAADGQGGFVLPLQGQPSSQPSRAPSPMHQGAPTAAAPQQPIPTHIAPQAPVQRREGPPREHRPQPAELHGRTPDRHSGGADALPSFTETLTATTPVQRQIPAQQPAQPAARAPDPATALQQSIARIHEACQAPPLSPPEYRLLFEISAREISERGLAGAQTITNIAQRGQELGLDIRRDDVRFVLEVVSEADPWFEQGASANVFAGRFRNFVVARCRSQGLNLSADELDLIEAWFVSGSVQPSAQPAPAPQQTQPHQPAHGHAPDPNYPMEDSLDAAVGDDDFPRFVRNRLRG